MTRDEIEQTIAAARAHIKEIGEVAAERGHFVRADGLTIGQGREQLSTRGAPKHHPVWADELREEIQAERRAGIETGPLQEVERDIEKYPTAWTPPMPAGWANLPRAWAQEGVNERQTDEREGWLKEFRDSPPRTEVNQRQTHEREEGHELGR